jgi:hypothetical protein
MLLCPGNGFQYLIKEKSGIHENEDLTEHMKAQKIGVEVI